MFSRLKAIVGTLLAMAVDSVDPVCQNRNAVILGQYKGFVVRLVPVEGSDGCVESWVPDPKEVQCIDSMLAEDPTLGFDQEPALPSLPPQPAPPKPATQPPLPPPLPPLP